MTSVTSMGAARPTGRRVWARVRRTSSSRSTPSQAPSSRVLSPNSGTDSGPGGLVDRRRGARGTNQRLTRTLRFRRRLLTACDRGSERRQGAGRGRSVGENGWRALAPGEFILGYEDEESRADPKRRLPSAPDDPLGRNGTYMVWRKLYQDVALFRRTVREASRVYPDGDERKLLAKIVGRWPNGAPLVTAPEAPSPRAFIPRRPAPTISATRRRIWTGLRCPLGAHVRRTNPRDALGFDGKLGVPAPHDPPRNALRATARTVVAIEDDGQDRGLVFVCFNASISRQFESMQASGSTTATASTSVRTPDFIIGGTHGKMTIQGDPPFSSSQRRDRS